MTDKIKVVRLGSALVCGTWADCFFEHEFLEYRMFLAHGWIYHAEDYILTSEFRRIVIRWKDYFPLVCGSTTNLAIKEKSIRFLSVC